jgi:hypothetical protein
MVANVRKLWINLPETLVCGLGFRKKMITLLKIKPHVVMIVTCYYGERYLSVQTGLYFPFNV